MKTIWLICSIFFIQLFVGQNNKIITDKDGTLLNDKIQVCPNQSIYLKLKIDNSTTDSYKAEIQPTPNVTYGKSIPIEIKRQGNNHFSKTIDLPFSFKFYGKTYAHMVIGSNGRLVFGDKNDIDKLYDSKDKVDTSIKLPNDFYNKLDGTQPDIPLKVAQIFLGFTELNYYNLDEYEKIKCEEVFYNNKRGIRVSFDKITLLKSNYNRNITSEVMFFEDNFFFIKVIKSNPNEKALLGIQNEDATKQETFKAEYNNGNWTSNANDAVSFLPNGTPLTTTIEWFLDNVRQSNWDNQKEINYTPTKNETLKANIIYKKIDNSIEKTDTGSVIFENHQKLMINRENKNGCLGGATLSIKNLQIDQIYQWYRNGIFLQEGNSITVGNTGDYTVQIKGCPSTRSDEEKVIVEDTKFPAFSFSKGQNFSQCGDADTKTINLQQLVNYPSGNYFIEFLDKDNQLITNANNYIIKSGVVSEITIKVSNSSGCEAKETFRVSYQKFPTNGTIFTSQKLCSDAIIFTTNDLRHQLNLNNDFEIKFQDNNENFILDEVNPQIVKSVKFQLKKSGYDCEYQYTLNFDFHETVKIMPITPFPEHCFHSSEYFDLNKTKKELEYHSDIKATFYSDSALLNPINNLNYRGSGMVYIKIENTKTGCIAPQIVQIELSVYRKPKLDKTTPEIKYSECGTDIYNLTTDINDYLKNWTKYKEIRYFDSKGNLLTRSEWEHYDASVKGNEPYMQFIYNETNNIECSDKIPFELIKKEKPNSKTNTIIICEEKSYSFIEFKNKIGAENFIILDENMQEMTQDFVWSQSPYMVKFYLKNKDTECISNLQTLTFTQGNPISINSKIENFTICDNDQDGKTTFNLNDWKNEITNEIDAILEFYTDVNHKQKIKNPQSFMNISPYTQTIYGKATKPNACPSYFQFDLKVNLPTQIEGIDNQYPCYGENISMMISNHSKFENIRWIAPNGTEIATGSRFYIDYEDIQFGDYKVLAINKMGCITEKTFTISDEKQPKIQEVNKSDYQIEVIATGGNLPYEYAFNDGNWQSSNILLNPKDSSYRIKIRANGCEGKPAFVYFLNFPNIITPNGDGKNDVWKVKYLDKMEDVSITIADRYGKTVFFTNNGAEAWNGTERGRKLNSGTYWYLVKWYDKNTHKSEVKQGWILLKNYE